MNNHRGIGGGNGNGDGNGNGSARSGRAQTADGGSRRRRTATGAAADHKVDPGWECRQTNLIERGRRLKKRPGQSDDTLVSTLTLTS